MVPIDFGTFPNKLNFTASQTESDMDSFGWSQRA